MLCLRQRIHQQWMSRRTALKDGSLIMRIIENHGQPLPCCAELSYQAIKWNVWARVINQQDFLV